MKKAFNYLLIGSLVVCSCGTIWASVQSDIEKANNNGKAVFLVITEPGAIGAEKAMSVAKQASNKVADSIAIEMNRADTNNNHLIDKYRLAGAQLPLILVVASNGVAAGGLPPDQATPEMLEQLIPSPKKAEVLQALSEGKAVFVVASRQSMANLEKVSDTCKDAFNQMKGKTAFVSIDMDDKKENLFLQQLRVNMSSTEPTTFVLNSKGQVTGNFSGPVVATQLVQATTKKAGGCCPGESNKGCASSNQKGQ